MALIYAKVHRMAIETFRDENVKRSSIMVYMDLARHCNASNCVLHHRDIKDIAENTGLSTRRVYAALEELDNVGLINRKSGADIEIRPYRDAGKQRGRI